LNQGSRVGMGRQFEEINHKLPQTVGIIHKSKLLNPDPVRFRHRFNRGEYIEGGV
jgi:hypothetical protein